MTIMKLVGNGPYDNHKADMIRDVKELSREELLKLLASEGSNGKVDSTSSGDVSGPAT